MEAAMEGPSPSPFPQRWAARGRARLPGEGRSRGWRNAGGRPAGWVGRLLPCTACYGQCALGLFLRGKGDFLVPSWSSFPLTDACVTGELRLGGRLCTGGRAVVSPGCGHRAVAGAEPQLAGAGRPGEPCQLRAAFPKAQQIRFVVRTPQNRCCRHGAACPAACQWHGVWGGCGRQVEIDSACLSLGCSCSLPCSALSPKALCWVMLQFLSCGESVDN